MTGKSGAARIALETGCPVIPVGQWGAHELLPPYTKTPHLFPRKHIRMLAGPPVVLEDLVALPRTQQVINTATERIMAAIVKLVEELRGEQAPSVRFDPRKAGLRLTGDPKKPEKEKS
jgi:1-acyl-sn-glycerol-3-phosphate acyltransferase